MRYAQIRPYDVANGEGIRVSIFVTGCTHNCPNCFNKAYQDFQFGDVWDDAATATVISYLEDPAVQGLTLLGGEPLQNRELLDVVREVKKAVDKDIWLYSGYTWEQIQGLGWQKDLLAECDVLVDGLFVEAQKDLTLRFRGSRNQRLIDVPQSLAAGEIVPYALS